MVGQPDAVGGLVDERAGEDRDPVPSSPNAALRTIPRSTRCSEGDPPASSSPGSRTAAGRSIGIDIRNVNAHIDL